MKRKYPLRNRLHPEVMVRGRLARPILDTVNKVLDGVRGPCSGHVARALEALGDPDVTHGQLMWAITRWEKCGKPIYYLEDGLAEALVHTDFPSDTFGRMELPEEALYLALPPIFSLEHHDTGEHPVEGVYLARDTIAVRVGEDGSVIWNMADRATTRVILGANVKYQHRDGISLVGIGAPKGIAAFVHPSGEIEAHEDARDDAIVTTSLLEGMPLRHRVYAYTGIGALLHVVVNLLYMMNNTTACEAERVVPAVDVKGSRERNKRRAIDEVEKKGKSLMPYTVLSLSPRVKKAAAHPGAPGRKIKYQTWVPGHFHSYWVLEPEEEKVIESKEGKGGTLHRVVHYLSPYKKGEGLPERPRNVVVKW